MKLNFTTIQEFPNYEICPISGGGIIRNKNNLKIISQYIGSQGYYMVTLRDKIAGHKPRRVHRLLAIAFKPNPNNLPEVNHKDGNKLNNDLDNFEWTDHDGNMKHAFRTGLVNNTGIRNGKAKLNDKQVLKIKQMLADGISQYKIAKIIGGISRSAVMNIKNRGQWKHIQS